MFGSTGLISSSSKLASRIRLRRLAQTTRNTTAATITAPVMIIMIAILRSADITSRLLLERTGESVVEFPKKRKKPFPLNKDSPPKKYNNPESQIQWQCYYRSHMSILVADTCNDAQVKRVNVLPKVMIFFRVLRFTPTGNVDRVGKN